MRATFDTRSFEKKLENIINYSIGVLDGVQQGKKVLLHKLGKETVIALYAYIDLEARAYPSELQHVYEWNKVGTPDGRLFDISYTVSNLGLSFKSKFLKSETVSGTSDTPFYNKAKIMESGKPITIAPKNSSVLVFEQDGETIFTSEPVTVEHPGGPEAQGSFERVFDEFMSRYFKQSFLKASGVYDNLKRPVLYKRNFAAGARMGRSLGVSTGFKWIANASGGIGK